MVIGFMLGGFGAGLDFFIYFSLGLCFVFLVVGLLHVVMLKFLSTFFRVILVCFHVRLD